jgi:DNA segregation ATPase FtsK/SpoIIIE, S-DNA-T family
MDRCETCRYVYDEVALDDAVAAIRALPARYGPPLRAAEADGLARIRPDPGTWSALEYTCHVRDVLQVQRERLALALAQDRPNLASMQREERVTRDRYNEQDVEVVLDQLADGATRFADACDALTSDQWQRTAIYNWPEPAERTMAWVLRHTVHEGIHHLADIERGIDRVRAFPPPAHP